MTLQQRRQSPQLNRLSPIHINPTRKRLLLAKLRTQASQGHNLGQHRLPLRPLPRADLARSNKPVHHGHRNIHKDVVKRLGGGFDGFERFEAVGRGYVLAAEASGVHAEDSEVDCVVVDEEKIGHGGGGRGGGGG